MGLISRYSRELARTRKLYESIGEVECPYFKDRIAFTGSGFHHLRFSAGRERGKKEQLLKFSLLQQFATRILTVSGTVQEYRVRAKESAHAGGVPMEYWGFVAILGEEERIRIKVIVRRLGKGKLHFWSIMRAERHKGDDAYYEES